MTYDTVINHGRWFDGTGAPSGYRHLGIRGGKVTAVSFEPLDEAGANVIDAEGKWVLPGLLDIHTHYDVEVLNGPGLSESVRHGVTTVMIGSCSLSTVHVDPEGAGDLFGRVEAIPRDHVIAALKHSKDWSSAREFVAALDRLPLGPNVFALIGHSDIRTAVMGLDRATRKNEKPTEAEQARMEEMLTEALDAGFAGMSAQQLLFDKVDGDVARSRTLPSTYAKQREYSKLNTVLRNRGRVLQAGPDPTSPLKTARFIASTVGWRRKKLKMSLLSAADLKAVPFLVHAFGPLGRILNKLGGDFRWQHLPVPFEVYADGIDLVIFEELGAGAEALHLRTQVERNELLKDEAYRRRFRKEYDRNLTPRVWHRDFFDAEIVDSPDASVIGKTFGAVGDERGVHPVDAYLDMVVEHGTKLRWRTTISNHRPKYLDKLATEPAVQIGFSDAGAHLRNMAFYNMGLRMLRRVHDAERAGQPFMTLEHAVHRLTGELADWYGVDAGHLREGDRADLVVIDPRHLNATLDEYHEEEVSQYGGLSRMVNRNDAAVSAVFVAGQQVIADGRPTETLGTERTGRFLRAAEQATA
ncbi:N-acyl-D-amino-acid deacylase family protein [Smaragdicoccus niigatensis]|uniref:N-acyl-D-amino-acid deacylase family protein n=1 Tax=Smaragdicoccus niigatensis TaxID=359359 RepID=UPI000363EB2B|nr:amidohydrolase family protein [Smaragdicoccus niigatensis]